MNDDHCDDAETQTFIHSVDTTWDEPVCAYLSTSLYSAYTLILFFIVQLKLSKTSIEKLLILLQAFLPTNNALAKTKYMFFKCLKLQLSMDTVHFCHKHGICDGEQCRHSDGTCVIDSMLWCHPVKQFVSRLSKDKRFYELAQSYRRRTKHTDDRICDIYDGIAYKKIASPVTNMPGGYSFLHNYDGATKWKSSLVSAIPIFMVCNELPFVERFKVENTIFCGVWFGTEKPNTNILFSSLVNDLLEGDIGVDITTPLGSIEKVRVRCLNSSCDLPAKAALLHQQQHGGYHACSFCNNSGLSMDKRFCYPLLASYGDVKFDHSSRKEDDIKAAYSVYDENISSSILQSNQKLPVIQGLNGISVFRRLPYWEWTLFSTIDFMHLLEGIFHLLMKLWMKSKVCSSIVIVELFLYSVGTMSQIVDAQVILICEYRADESQIPRVERN